jgi:dTDP-4-amino-4,6-dideoxygalactose transaminase
MSKLAILGGKPVRKRPFPSWPIYTSEEEAQLKEVLHESKLGRKVGKIVEFEQEFCQYHKVKYAVACTNCSQALEIILKVACIGEGDEVIIPSYTFIATAGAVVRCGASCVFIDINSEDYLLDIDLIERLITPRTRAIIPVYFGGNIPDMDRINKIAKKYNLVVIEDAAQAHGGKWNGRFVGNFGKAAGFSFQYSKNMTANEGGIILSNDRRFIERCWQYIWHGRRKKGLWYEHFQISSNFRLTEFQAAILIAQLGRLKKQNEIRHQNGLYLDRKLSKIEGIYPLFCHPFLEIHPRHIYIIRFKLDLFRGITKDNIIKALNAEGIPVSAGYGFPLYKNPAFQRMRLRNFKKINNPKAEKACKESVWLMHHNLLGTKKDMDDIVSALEKITENRQSLKDIR